MSDNTSSNNNTRRRRTNRRPRTKETPSNALDDDNDSALNRHKRPKNALPCSSLASTRFLDEPMDVDNDAKSVQDQREGKNMEKVASWWPMRDRHSLPQPHLSTTTPDHYRVRPTHEIDTQCTAWYNTLSDPDAFIEKTKASVDTLTVEDFRRYKYARLRRAKEEARKKMECSRSEGKDQKPWGANTGWEKGYIGESLIHQMEAHLENKVYVRSSTTKGQEMLHQMSEGKPVFYDETKRVDLRGFWEEFFGDWIGEKDTLEIDALAVLPSSFFSDRCGSCKGLRGYNVKVE